MKYPHLVLDRCKYIPTLVSGLSILDIGCVGHNLERRKYGHWLHEHLINSASNVLGLDYEAKEVEKMKSEGFNVELGDATNFSLAQSFDAVVAGELIEHISNPGLFLDCARKHLKKDGKLLLTTPNANSLTYFFENLIFGSEIDNPDHISFYTPKTISQLLKRHEFKVEKVIFLAENTVYFHKSPLIKLLVLFKYILQLIISFLRPNMSQNILVIAKKI